MKHTKKMTAVVLSLLLIFCMGAGGTLAYLIDKHGPVVNEFQTANVTPTILETFNKKTKENVRIKNSGNANAYVRVAVVASWQISDGVLYGDELELDKNYILEGGSSKWFQASDGFYYYKDPVAPGGETEILFAKATPMGDLPEGCKLHIEIVANTIQSDWNGTDVTKHPAAQHWGVTVNADGTISKS